MKLWQCDPGSTTFLEQALRLAADGSPAISQYATGRCGEEPPLEEAIELLVDDFHQGTGILVNTH